MTRFFVALAALLILATGAAAAPTPGAAPAGGRFQYPDSRLQTQEAPLPAKPWAQGERQKVEAAIAQIAQAAPGLVQRAGQYRQIRVYRTATLGGDKQPVGMVASEHVLFVADHFFAGSASGQVSMKDNGFALARALAHLADAAGRASGSKDWVQLVQPLMDKARTRAKELKTTLTGLSGAGNEQVAAELNLPSIFAAFSRSEALAQYAAALAVKKDFPAPPAIRTFVEKRMLANGQPEEAAKKYFDGLSQMEQGKFDEAMKLFDQAVKLDAGFRDAYYRRGLVEKFRGQWEKAAVNFDMAVKTSNGSPPPQLLVERGFAYLQRKETDKAIADFTAVLDYAPGPAVDYYARCLGMRAEGYMLKKDWQKAAADFTSILAFDPNHSVSYRLRGRAKFEMQDAVGAIDDLNKAIALDKSDPDAYFIRGYAYGSLKQYKQAKADLEEAQRLAPNLQPTVKPALDFVNGEIAKGK
jgi:tetratricopeptide (TPR) repeat protein